MTEAQHEQAHHEEGHDDRLMKIYYAVAVALAVFTAASFVVNFMVRSDILTPTAGFLLILGVAVCKAVLVGLYFMHLYFDWGKLYFMIVPAFILGVMMMFALLPDIVLAWR